MRDIVNLGKNKFRDVNKNLGWGLPPFWLTDFSIDLYLLANEIKVVKMITETFPCIK